MPRSVLGVERDPIPLDARQHFIARDVATEIEEVRGHCVFAGQLLGQPPSRGDGMKPHPVRVLGKRRLRTPGIKRRLEVLNEIEPLPGTGIVERHVRRRPCRREYRVGVGHAVEGIVNLASLRRIAAPHRRLVIYVCPPPMS